MSSSIDNLSEIQGRIDKVRRFLAITLSIANAHTVEFYTHDVWKRLIAVAPEDVLSAINSKEGRQRESKLNRNGLVPSNKAREPIVLRRWYHAVSLRHESPRLPVSVEKMAEFCENPKTIFGFCEDKKRLIDIYELLEAAKDHSIPGLGVCMSREQLLQSLRGNSPVSSHTEEVVQIEAGEFMNSKKSHEVQSMSEVVSCLAQRCGVKQVIDVGSGKGYLCSFLSLKYGLQVFGIDSSSTNTHGAQERNRKLKRFSRAYQKHTEAAKSRQREPASLPYDGGAGQAKPRGRRVEEDVAAGTEESERLGGNYEWKAAKEDNSLRLEAEEREEEESAAELLELATSLDVGLLPEREMDHKVLEHSDRDALFLSTLPMEVIEAAPRRVSPGTLSPEERGRRKRENLERKARSRPEAGRLLFSPLTSYVTAETELRELINELQDAVMVGLHTCGDLAPSTLRMFVAKPELTSVCSVGCCYHLLSEEFDPAGQEGCGGGCGFPMSLYLQERSWFCGRNARMSACLALERVSVGQGIQMESLFYRAVLHVILRDHYDSFKSEKRVGNIYSKSTSFVDYVHKALRRLDLDETKLSDGVIQDYYNSHRPRMAEMHAFNMLKVMLAPCIEGVVLLDRLCYLKEQEDIAFSGLVQLFDPLLSPRCYAIVGVKTAGKAEGLHNDKKQD